MSGPCASPACTVTFDASLAPVNDPRDVDFGRDMVSRMLRATQATVDTVAACSGGADPRPAPHPGRGTRRSRCLRHVPGVDRGDGAADSAGRAGAPAHHRRPVRHPSHLQAPAPGWWRRVGCSWSATRAEPPEESARPRSLEGLVVCCVPREDGRPATRVPGRSRRHSDGVEGRRGYSSSDPSLCTKARSRSAVPITTSTTRTATRVSVSQFQPSKGMHSCGRARGFEPPER